jgi:hypothetical protein
VWTVRWKPPILLLLALAIGLASAAMTAAEAPTSHQCPCSASGNDPCNGCCPEAPATDAAGGCGSSTDPGFCGCTPDPGLTAIFVPVHEQTREHAHERAHALVGGGEVPSTNPKMLSVLALPDRSPPTEPPGLAAHGNWRL